MVTNLEGLIAKGRRVTHIREQREVAFGLADVSTHSELHERIVQKGGFKTLIHLLNHSRDIEAQRFAALAMANTASSDAVRVTIAQEEKVIFYLLEHTKGEENDVIVRQYCAMTIGNLAASRENHSIITDSSGISILVAFLKSGTNDQNYETSQYAAFALSNLSSNDICSKQMADLGALEYLSLAACFDDTIVQRQALTALRGICNCTDYHSEAISVGILDPLILLARSVEVNVLQDVAALFHRLSSTVPIRMILSDRALSTIVLLSVSDDILTQRHAICTIANLSEILDIHQKLINENVLAPLVAMLSSKDLNSKGQACRAFANLSTNVQLHSSLLDDKVIEALVNVINENETNSQRYSAVCLANLARTVRVQTKVAQIGSIRRLNDMISNVTGHFDVRKYACLVIANLSATKANHKLLLREGSLDAILSLSNSDDSRSKYYVTVALSNLGSNLDNHSLMVQEGSIQPLISLLYGDDIDVQRLACAALRGLSYSSNFRIKIIQEGGLEPLSDLLYSKDILLLRETCSCLLNISGDNEGKIEMVNFGIIKPLVSLLDHDDQSVSSFCTAALANLSEIQSNKDIIASHGVIKPCIDVMISKNLETQREGGRLLANICSCNSMKAIDFIFECGGHHVLTSYLLSRDIYSQHIGLFGVCCLSFHDRHRVTLKDIGVLDPLSLMVQSNEISITIKKFALLAMVYLSSENNNHRDFLSASIFNNVVSLSVSSDSYVRVYAAMIIANLGRNMNLSQIISDEGGLEPILYLARIKNEKTRLEALPAFASLSFIRKNRDDICLYGGLFSILQGLQEEDTFYLRCACCVVANLSEQPSISIQLVEAGVLDLLTHVVLITNNGNVICETARAIGNLATNICYSTRLLSQQHVLHSLVNIIKSNVIDHRQMAAMALSNLCANSKCHGPIIEMGILDAISDEFQISLDPKRDSDHHTTRYFLSLVSNLCASNNYGEHVIISNLDNLVKFSNHRDIKCRQNAIIAIGNLCYKANNANVLKNAGVPSILITHAFPSNEQDSSSAHHQAIAGLRGLATNKNIRNLLVESGSCEPLTLSLRSHNIDDNEITCETAAAIYNLALSTQSGLFIVESGILHALTSSLGSFDDASKMFAIGTLANLAEKGINAQYKLVDDGCISILSDLLQASDSSEEIKYEIVRCFALLSTSFELHERFLDPCFLDGLIRIFSSELFDVGCKALATLTIANLASSANSHRHLVESGLMSLLPSLQHVDNHQLKRSLAYAFHNISKNVTTHQACHNSDIAGVLSNLITEGDEFCTLHACLAVRYSCISECIGRKFIDIDGIPILLRVLKSSSLEHKREVVGALRNMSLSCGNKQLLLKHGCITALLDIIRCSDGILLQQGFATIANIAEDASNRTEMVEQGILQHLKYGLKFYSKRVRRESLRAISNLSSDVSCIGAIEKAGISISLISSLSANELSSRTFAAISISNLTTDEKTRERLIKEGCIDSLFHLYTEANGKDEMTAQHCFTALSNLAVSTTVHEILLNCKIVQMCCLILEGQSNCLIKAALSCLANLASNCNNHSALQVTATSTIILGMLDCLEETLLHYAVLFLRGLSTSAVPRNLLLKFNIVDKLLNVVQVQNENILAEALLVLCNLSSDDQFQDYLIECLNRFQPYDLESLFIENRFSSKLFGAIMFGNGITKADFRDNILNLDSLDRLISEYYNGCNHELARCLAYSLCNASKQADHRSHIVRSKGLIPVLILTRSEFETDVYNSLQSIRAICTDTKLATLIVENGSVDYLLDVCVKNLSNRCTIEALEAIYFLSRNDKNKETIIQCLDIRVMLQLSDISVQIATLLTGVLASCSEINVFHSHIIEHIPMIKFAYQVEGSSYYEQFTRLLSNLCANTENHIRLLSSASSEWLLECAAYDNCIAQRHLLQGLYNLSINCTIQLHKNPFVWKMTSRLVQIITLKDSLEFDIVLISFACLTIGSLFKIPLFWTYFNNLDVSQSLQVVLSNNNDELKYSAAFAIHKYLKYADEFKETVLSLDVVYALLDELSNKECNFKSHVVGALKYLAKTYDLSREIINHGGLELLSGLVDQCATLELKREIACSFFYLTTNPDILKLFVSSSAFDVTIKLYESHDMECTRYAIATLANISEDPTTHRCILIYSDIVPDLIHCLTSKSLAVMREATRAISNLLSEYDSFATFVSYEGLQILDRISTVSDKEIQLYCALSLRKLASCVQVHNDLLSHGSLETMFRLIKIQSKNVDAARLACMGLHDYISSRNVKMHLLENCDSNRFLSILCTEDEVIKTSAAAILDHLSVVPQLRKAFLNGDILPLLYNCIDDETNINLLIHISAVLSNLSETEKGRMMLWSDERFKDILHRLVIHENTIICLNVARCMGFLSVTVPKSICSDTDIIVISTAIKMITMDRTQVIKYALMTIGNLAQDLKYQSIACDMNVVQHLTSIIMKNSDHLALALWVLSRVIIPDKNTHLCYHQTSFIDKLLSCLHAKNICVRHHTCSVLCNISSNTSILRFLSDSDVKDLLALIHDNCTNTNTQTAIVGLKTLCNITAFFNEIDRGAIRKITISNLLNICKQESCNTLKEFAVMVLSNLSISGISIASICSADDVELSCIFCDNNDDKAKRAIAMMFYNFSLSEDSHDFLGTPSVVQCLGALCNSEIHLCRLLSIMSLSNISGNDHYRNQVVKNGGLKTAVLMLNDSDFDCRARACMFLSNLTSSSTARNQAVLYGCLPSLKSALESSNLTLRRCARLAMINLVSDAKNHDTFFGKNIFHNLMNEENEDYELVAFSIINALISDAFRHSEHVVQSWSILIELIGSDAYHLCCAATVALKQLIMSEIIPICVNWKHILKALNNKVMVDEINIQREIAGLIQIISNNIQQAKLVAEYSKNEVQFLSQQMDTEILTCTASTIASLAETEECRSFISSVALVRYSIPLLQHKCIRVKREAYRAIASLSTDIDVHAYFVSKGISYLFSSCELHDVECELFLSIICRGLKDFRHSSSFMSKQGMPYFCRMIRSIKEETVKNTLIVLKNLASTSFGRSTIGNSGIVTDLSAFLESENEDFKILSISIFFELSADSSLQKLIMSDKSILTKAAKVIRSNSNLMSSQMAGLLANLSENDNNRTEMVDAGVISMLLALSRYEEIQVLRYTSRALANLALNKLKCINIFEQGGLSCIMNLIVTNDSTCVFFASITLNLLCTNERIRIDIINSDDMHCIKTIVNTDSTTCHLGSAVLLALMSLNDQNRYKLAEHFLPVILRLCMNADVTVKRNAFTALANLAESYSIHHILLEGSIVLEMSRMASNIFDSVVTREWTRIFATLSINDTAKADMLLHNIESLFVKFGRRADCAIQRYIVVSICNLCLYTKEKPRVIGNESLLRILSFLSKSTDLEVERGAILSFSSLALGSNDHAIEDMLNRGVFDLILDALRYPDVSMKQCASLMMNTLLLGDTDIVKLKFYDNRHVIGLVMSLLDSADDECIHNAVYIIGSLIENRNLRKTIVELDGISHVTRIFSSSSVDVKRVCGYVYCILSEEKEYHSLLKNTDAIQNAVTLAGMVDEECQFYGSFALFHLASNPDLQKLIAGMGAVRNLVSILATDASTRHCAGLTLLRLADNFENHIIIAEEGGINALIKLGKKGKSKSGTLQMKATSTLSHLASETIASLPSLTPLERDKLNNRNFK